MRGQDGWILAEFSFCIFMEEDEVEVHKNENETGSPRQAVSLHLACSGSQSEHRICRILPARGACHIIKRPYLNSMVLLCHLLFLLIKNPIY